MAEEVDLKELKTSNQINEKAKEDMNKILKELKQKMSEIDIITKELQEKRSEFEKVSPQKTKRLLEEIKVPPLELLQ